MSDTPLGALFFGFIVTTLFAVYLPVALQALGLLWAPFAAWICAWNARRKGLDARRHAIAGALYSALMFLPWVYFVLRMNGKHVHVMLVRLFYISVFTSWLLGPIFWTFISAIAAHPGTDSLYEFSSPWVILSYILYALLLAKGVVWLVSLRMVRRRWRRDSASEPRADAMIAREYLLPLACAAVSTALAAFILFRLEPIWVSMFGERP